MIQLLPTSTLFPYTTLFRSDVNHMVMKNPFKWAVTNWQNRQRSPSNVVPFPNQQGQGVLPVGVDGKIVSPHEFLQAQIVNLPEDRKSTRLNSSHTVISYAVF